MAIPQDDVVTRQELYELMWSKPKHEVAKELGLSGYRLVEICKKMDIPRPPIGYWQKQRAGKKGVPPPLPDPQQDEILHIPSKQRYTREQYMATQSRQVPEYETFERKPENKIIVAGQLTKPYPLVVQARQSLRGGEVERQYGWIWPREHPCIHIRVSPDALDRALRIMDALLKGLKKRRIDVEVVDGALRDPTTFAVFKGERIPFDMFESPQKGMKEDFWGKKMVEGMVPSGRLVLRIRNAHASNRAEFRDQNTVPLEDRLNDFVVELHREVKAREETRIREEQNRAAKKEEQRKAEELRKQQEAEAVKFGELESFVANWRKAQDIREFVAAVEQTHECARGIPAGSELERWLEWALGQADRLDPSVPATLEPKMI